MQALVSSFAGEVFRLVDAASGTDGLTVEVIPSSAVQLLPDYEKLVGLPYPGFNLAGTTALRQADVVSILIAQGGQSKAYFLTIIGAHGHVGAWITDDYGPFDCGDNCGDPLYGLAWAFYWQVNMHEAGPDTLLEYLLNRWKPAHTTVGFVYNL
jgi:uncharacterized protein YmfQ (DUF2313 family)